MCSLQFAKAGSAAAMSQNSADVQRGSFAPAAMYLRLELELERIQTQMAHKPMLRAKVYARALRAGH
jgi:hypothetical protein